MSRGGRRSPPILPKPELPVVVFGLLKCGELARLKKSASNRSLRFSAPNFVSLAMDTSQLWMPGPRTCPTPPLPKVYGGGSLKQLVSNHWFTLFGVDTDEQLMLA